MPKLAIPIGANEGLNSRIFGHFGRARQFAIVEYETDPSSAQITVVNNMSEHFGGMGKASEQIVNNKVDAIITVGMGQRAIDMMQEQKIAVYQATPDLTVQDIVNAYASNQLPELTDGCGESRHDHEH